MDKLKFDVAIIASVIPARFELLLRSMETWIASAEHSGLDVVICLYFDGFLDSEGLPAYPIPVIVPPYRNTKIAARNESSGSHIYGYNYWLDEIDADVTIFTHPEIMFPHTLIPTAVSLAEVDRYVAFKVMWLPKFVTEQLDMYPWHNPEDLELEEDIYHLDEKQKGEFYWNVDVRDKKLWESTTTWAMDRSTLSKITPFTDFGEQGPDDPAMAGIRSVLGIKNHTVKDPLVFHQWHESTWFGTPSDAVTKASAAISKFIKERNL